MTRESQKNIELNHAIMLLKSLHKDLSSLSIAQTDPPDLQFIDEDKNISIEHSLLLTKRGQKLKEEVAAFENLISEVNGLYRLNEHGLLRVWVWFKYGGHLDLKKKQLDIVAQELMDLCIRFNPGLVGNFYDSTVPEEHLPAYANKITIWNTDNAGHIGFSKSSMVISGALPIEILKDAVDSKSNKLMRYYDKYDENWLLLVADGSQASQFADFHPSGVEQFQHSEYDHIYILEAFTNEIHIIK